MANEGYLRYLFLVFCLFAAIGPGREVVAHLRARAAAKTITQYGPLPEWPITWMDALLGVCSLMLLIAGQKGRNHRSSPEICRAPLLGSRDSRWRHRTTSIQPMDFSALCRFVIGSGGLIGTRTITDASSDSEARVIASCSYGGANTESARDAVNGPRPAHMPLQPTSSAGGPS